MLFIRMLRTLCCVYYLYFLEYRAELILWMLAGLLPFIMMGVWIQAGNAGEFPLSSLEFSRYFMTVFLVRQTSVVWVIYEFEADLMLGKLASKLLQPLDPMLHYLSMHIGEQWSRLPFSFLLIIIFFLLYPEALWKPQLSNSILFLLSLINAFLLRFFMQYTLSLLGFWVEKISSADRFFFLCYLFLSGLIAPLDVYPEFLRRSLYWTPFPYMIDFPVSLLIGNPESIILKFMVVSGWIVTFFLINRLLWRKGIKEYSAMGS